VEIRQALLWSGLLFGGQTTDTITTAIDRARGALELMPVSGQLLDHGGIPLLWATKVMVALVATAVLVLAARSVRPDHRISRITYRVALISVQAATVVLAWASLSNVVLLGNLAS